MAMLGRVLTAMVTPFKADLSVDYARAAELARRLVELRSDGIVVAGTTGESPTLDKDEKLKLIETVLEAVGDRVKVIAGTGTNNTAASIELTRRAEALGAHGCMLVGPYYNKPPQEGLYRHFRSVAEATSLPVMLYNVPGRTGSSIAPETVARLAEIPNIVAIKEASGSLDQVSDILRRVPSSFAVYSGDDNLTLPILSVGGVGVVSVASHLVGDRIAAMIEAFISGRVREAAEIHLSLMPLFKALFVTANPIPVKRALRLIGFDVGDYRLPLVSPSEKEEQVISGALRECGLM